MRRNRYRDLDRYGRLQQTTCFSIKDYYCQPGCTADHDSTRTDNSRMWRTACSQHVKLYQ